jgi:F-type H+-transporting ATPase subunit b
MEDVADNIQPSAVIVQARPGAGDAHPGLLDPSVTMVTLTWLVFGLLALVLHKVAWKPILGALDAREKSIRDALDAAAHARAECSAVEEKSRALLSDARRKSEAVVSAAYEKAARIGAAAEAEARERSRSMLDAAAAEIENAMRRAREALRAETADLSLMVAERLVREKMDTEANRVLAKRLAEELKDESQAMRR